MRVKPHRRPGSVNQSELSIECQPSRATINLTDGSARKYGQDKARVSIPAVKKYEVYSPATDLLSSPHSSLSETQTTIQFSLLS
jgi:hypothetical protein